jgi:histidine phosphotransferase ChpT
MRNDFFLMHLMCARICHDLSAPVSAIAMGLEMLEEEKSSSDGKNATKKLLDSSISSTIAKIEVFRSLTGFSGQLDKPTGMDLKQVLDGYWPDDKIKIKWETANVESLKGSPARLILAVLLIAAEAIYNGGTLTVHENFDITAEGFPAKLRPESKSVFKGEFCVEDITVKTIVAYFAFLLSQELGGEIDVNTEFDNQLCIRFIKEQGN